MGGNGRMDGEKIMLISSSVMLLVDLALNLFSTIKGGIIVVFHQ